MAGQLHSLLAAASSLPSALVADIMASMLDWLLHR